MGTIMYALSEQAGRRRKGAGTGTGDAGSDSAGVGGGGGGRGRGGGREGMGGGMSAEELQTAAALYICCAQATDSRPVYASSLRLVRHRRGGRRLRVDSKD